MAGAARGVQWPLSSNQSRNSKRPSTTYAVKGALIAAYLASEHNDQHREAVRELRLERKWRKKYPKHFLAHVRAIAHASGDDAVRMMSAGLDYLHSKFRFISHQGLVTPLRVAMQHPRPKYYVSVGTRRTAQPAGGWRRELTVPYDNKLLSGKKLRKQAQIWADKGVIEPSAADAISEASHRIADGSWSTRLSTHVFVVLGSGAAMGPAATLLALGASVIAVDLPGRPRMWSKLFNLVKEKGLSGCQLLVPLRRSEAKRLNISSNGLSTLDLDFTNPSILASTIGSDLLRDTPEIADWLTSVCPDQKMVIGCYAYRDGAEFTRLSVAMDAVVARVLASRPGTSLAYLGGASDVYARPAGARVEALHSYSQRPLWMKVLNKASFNSLCLPNASNETLLKPPFPRDVDLVDGITVEQGPNYLFAKRIQHWRAMISRWGSSGSRSGACTVSSNVAPSAATRSVTHNWRLKGALAGTKWFPPLEIFDPSTANAVMAAALIHDMCNPHSLAQADVGIAHPLLLLSQGAWHGGVWRVSVSVASSGKIAAVLGLTEQGAQKARDVAVMLGLAAVPLWLFKRVRSML